MLVFGFIPGSTNVNNITTKAIDLMLRAKEIQDPQMELLLLRCCTGSPKIAYWSRTCNPTIITAELDTFDRGMDAALQHIIGVPISGINRDLAHLPLSFGGLGIPRVSLIADFAFVSSIGSSWKLQPQFTPRLGYYECATRITQNRSCSTITHQELDCFSAIYTTKGVQSTNHDH